MEIRQLRYFVATAEKLNFSEAARTLCVTQGTLSQQISALEGELDVTLFERNKHSVRLTDMGEALLPSAIRALNEITSCTEKMEDAKRIESGMLNIGTTYTFSPLLQDTMIQFIHQHPKVKLNVVCKSMEELLNMLKHHEIDIAISYKPHDLSEDIESHVLVDSRLCIAVSKKHPLAKKKNVTIHDIEKYPVCLPAKGLQARNTIDRFLSSSVYTELNVRIEINDVYMLLNLIENDNLLSFVSQATIFDRPDIVGIPIDRNDLVMQGAFHILKNSYIKYATRSFIKLLCENKSFSMSMLPFMCDDL